MIEPFLETDSISPGQVHCLPHHPIFKERKTRKICMAYDASSNTAGLSLNDCLYPGRYSLRNQNNTPNKLSQDALVKVFLVCYFDSKSIVLHSSPI